MRFTAFIGVDYSGAGRADLPNAALQVYQCQPGGIAKRVAPPQKRHWSRLQVAEYLEEQIQTQCCLIGIDHAFGFPANYLQRHQLSSWSEFLKDFVQHWPTQRGTVEDYRLGNPRTGSGSELRLTDQWTTSAKSVFLFDVQGSVAKSTHAGLPWLQKLHQQHAAMLHVWPFDGWSILEGKSMVAEVYPSLIRRRLRQPHVSEAKTADERDAWAIAEWLRQITEHNFLARYLQPPLTEVERQRAELEGWIFGVC